MLEEQIINDTIAKSLNNKIIKLREKNRVLVCIRTGLRLL